MADDRVSPTPWRSQARLNKARCFDLDLQCPLPLIARAALNARFTIRSNARHAGRGRLTVLHFRCSLTT